ncbi:uncharacterized protein Z518_05264 [Rhinocladiella mackenziei CBS 650.93]|uniref:MT-A70-domain-containing protein n=1 Tax=Rhinocladiella mackenziei CBS 650.93 TaxID=1442369 RepID=A0A0D2IMM1_9EURO|nr:uncharacterized protein Z518_05264 [Rhinocladiella mackenziei CBS 650.93]KIX04396.1 hypothetical protein Z518_05264 [Rhinocladiella mackenziei CBS 650.93]
MLPVVLYRNHTQTAILLDLPASIQHGQQVPYVLKSCPALLVPYPSTEPKGYKRETALNAIPIHDRAYHMSVQEDISSALIEARDYLHGRSGSWYFPRHDFASQNASFGHSHWTEGTDHSPTLVPVILSTTEVHNKFSSLSDLYGIVICNPRQADIAIIDADGTGDFIVPPGSVFILSTLESGLPAFVSASHALLASKPFDLILMDPPWSNRSVRHSGTYRTSDDQMNDPFQQAVRIMNDSLAPEGLVAIWITNKSSIRSNVLEMLQALDLHLCEEWVWIKITAGGQPVTKLDGVWRRPYEILLLFRKCQQCEDPRHRIIMAVPDLHSRKPCLKILLEELLPADYNALELFARSLTAGWWSWGDEVLKFQHESQWTGYENTKRRSFFS